MPATVVVRGLRLNGHEPGCAVGLEGDACRANCFAGALRRIKAIDMPEQRLLQATWQQFVLNDAATKLTSPLGRVLDAGRHQLRSCHIRRQQGEQHPPDCATCRVRFHWESCRPIYEALHTESPFHSGLHVCGTPRAYRMVCSKVSSLNKFERVV